MLLRYKLTLTYYVSVYYLFQLYIQLDSYFFKTVILEKNCKGSVVNLSIFHEI